MFFRFLISIFLIITCFTKAQTSNLKIDQSNLIWKSYVDSAIKLIEQTDDLRFYILNKVCREIKFLTDPSQVSKDSILILNTEIFEERSVNVIACSIVFESKHLEIQTWKTDMTKKKIEYFCYLTEYAFFSKLKNGEEWLKDFLINMMIEYQ